MCLGIPGQIVEISDRANFIAKVEVAGARCNVNVALLDQEDLKPGDWVLIHVGFAMSKLDEQEARETLKVLREYEQTVENELRRLQESEIG